MTTRFSLEELRDLDTKVAKYEKHQEEESLTSCHHVHEMTMQRSTPKFRS
jgi:hypothetical protein